MLVALPTSLSVWSFSFEPVRVMACVACHHFESVQWRAWVTASISMVKLEVETVRATLSL